MWIIILITILVCIFVKRGKLLNENLESLLYVHESKQSNSRKEIETEDKVSDDQDTSENTIETEQNKDKVKTKTKEEKPRRGISRKRIDPNNLDDSKSLGDQLLDKLGQDASVDDIAETGLDYIRGNNA